MPGLRMRLGRRLHAWVGGGLALAVVVHAAALWLTSPPDVVDALLFRSPTPFSAWGVVAMWVVFATALTLLAPDIFDAILDGRQPDGMTLPGLMEPFPVEWERQARRAES